MGSRAEIVNAGDRSRARTCTPQLRRLVLYPVERCGPWSGGRAGVLGRDPKALGRGRELALAHHAIAHARSDAHHAQRLRNALSRNALLDELLDHALKELDELLGGDVGPHGAPPFGPPLWPDSPKDALTASPKPRLSAVLFAERRFGTSAKHGR